MGYRDIVLIDKLPGSIPVWKGRKVNHHVYALKGGLDGFKVGHVGHQRIEAWDGLDIHSTQFVCVGQVLAQDTPYQARRTGYQDSLLARHRCLLIRIKASDVNPTDDQIALTTTNVRLRGRDPNTARIEIFPH